jgi:hypothetical protein
MLVEFFDKLGAEDVLEFPDLNLIKLTVKGGYDCTGLPGPFLNKLLLAHERKGLLPRGENT